MMTSPLFRLVPMLLVVVCHVSSLNNHRRVSLRMAGIVMTQLAHFPFPFAFGTCIRHYVQNGEIELNERGTQDTEETPDSRARLIVTTILEPPYMMLKQDGVFLTGNDRFEGFLADVLRSLSRSVGFSYELRLVQDGKYGVEGENGTWSGMIGEIYKGYADLAVGPIVVTTDREKVVEFTDSILTFQSCALLRKPKHAHRKRKPRTRTKIKSLLELYESPDFQYGVISGSTTESMFMNSEVDILQGMWTDMVNAWPSAFVHSLQEGVQRVERDNYAFILDTPMADYISSRKPCALYTTETFLDEQYYAFAMRHSHSMRLRESLNEKISELKHSGELQGLYDTWWRSECDKKRDLAGVQAQPTTTVSPWRFVTVKNINNYYSGRSSASKNGAGFTLLLTIYCLWFAIM